MTFEKHLNLKKNIIWENGVLSFEEAEFPKLFENSRLPVKAETSTERRYFKTAKN